MATRLAMVFTRYPVWNQTFCVADLAALERVGFEVEIFTLLGPKGSMQQPEVAQLRAPVHRVPVATWSFWREVGQALRHPRAWQLWGRLMWAARTSPAELVKALVLFPQGLYLASRMQARGIQHVHAAFASYPATIAWMIAELVGLPFSFSAHAYDVYKVQTLLTEKIRLARFVHTCAEVNRQELLRLAGPGVRDKIHVHRHGVDLQRFKPAARTTREPQAPWRLLACGNLVPQKGFEYLVAACERLQQHGDRFTCTIIGEGPEGDTLARQVHQAGLASAVRFLPPVPQPQLADHYRQADLFVMPAVVAKNGERDVIPNVLVEAMASGTPVVATYMPGIQELVQDGVNGALVPCAHPQALAEAISAVMGDEGKRQHLRQSALRVIRDVYDRRRNAAALMQTFMHYVTDPPARGG